MTAPNMAVPTRQPEMFAAVTITLAVALIALILRFVARRMTKVPLWWDDFMCVGAFLFAAGWSALLILYNGLTADQSLSKSLFFCYLAELFYAFSLAFSKFAILAFYWRMFRTSNIKVPIITLAVATSIWLILRILTDCVPVQAFWDKSIHNATCNINDAKFFFGTVLVHLILDLFILSLPVLQVRKLQLRTAQKVGVTAMFTFGILYEKFFYDTMAPESDARRVCIASVVVLIYSVYYDSTSPEISWNIAPIMTWATVETNLAVVSACLPMLRPIFLRAFHRIFPNVSANSSNKKYGTNNPKSFIKMSSMRTKSNSADESDSMHQLADSDNDLNSDVGDDCHRIGGMQGPRVFITGKEVVPDPERAVTPASGAGGILVRSETFIEVTKAR